ncbi:hypothetical protein [Sphingobacterium prati]|uniref:hypothetical protein n=1 Tax=Sphingobacterium prati TaxID=2737006 RepID=UPI00155672CF|nr:hypothetical protein [Sphingobacterium prati]NPE46933.1 hypothetical protein [Sphingobacterium prati]
MKLFKPLIAFFLCLITVVSCKKNETTDADGSAGISGSFIGRVQFQDNSLSVDRSNRLIRILPDGGSQSFKIEFFTGVPNITGVRFEKFNDTTWISNDTIKLKDVKIRGKLLTINYQLDGQTWHVIDAIRK